LPTFFSRHPPLGTAASQQRATKNVLHPLLWLTALVTPASAALAVASNGPLVFALMALAVLPPIATVVAFAIFSITNPDRLHTEEFLLQQQWFQAQIGDNTKGEVITLQGESATPVSNSALTGGPRDV
jgi:hypothetical protein